MNTKMNNIAKDIILMEFGNKKTLEQLAKEFYAICKKHGIKAHTKTKRGMIGHRFEYTMAKGLFTKMLAESFNFLEWNLKVNKFPSVKQPKEVEI